MKKIITIGSYTIWLDGKTVRAHGKGCDLDICIRINSHQFTLGDARRVLSGRAKSVKTLPVLYVKNHVWIGCTKIRLTTVKRIAKLLE